MAERVVIAGGSGFLGMNLTRHLVSLGHEVVVLARGSVAGLPDGSRAARWDGRSLGDWASELDGASGLVNLCGRTVDCRKTPDHCDEILRSRVESTRVLGEATAALAPDRRPGVWVQMSTGHIYGDPPRVVCDEGSALGYGLAPTVGKAWEAAFDKSCPEGVRRVVLRTSFVLGKRGGAFPMLKRLARLGLGGRVGRGTQGVSWLHERDMDRLFERGLTDASMQGMYIATAPEPVGYTEFMRTLRRVVGMPIGLPGPAWGVRLAAATVLRTDPELVLYGRRLVSKRLEDEGFEFEYGGLEAALRELCGKG
ncbi:MAG: epimerase [Phycisphaerales bacterium JB040]